MIHTQFSEKGYEGNENWSSIELGDQNILSLHAMQSGSKYLFCIIPRVRKRMNRRVVRWRGANIGHMLKSGFQSITHGFVFFVNEAPVDIVL